MYSYYYPSFYSPTQPPVGSMVPGMGNMPPGMTGMQQGTAGQGITPAGQAPTGISPYFGSTAGPPVTSTPPAPPTIEPSPVTFQPEQGPPVTSDIGYTQAYLKSRIGSRVRIEFLIGTNMLTDRIGTLVDVGISYVIIRLEDTDDLMLGDIYSIKFVTFYR